MEKEIKARKISIWPIVLNTITALSVIVICIALCAAYQKLSSSDEAFKTYVQSLRDYNKTPVLVFRQTDFFKYLIRGTKDSGSKHSDMLQVYLVRGKADFGFDLSQAAIDQSKTSYLRRSLVVNFKSSSYFPVFADITIKEDDIVEVETIFPEPYTEEEATQKAVSAAVVGSGLGALLGGSAFSLFGLEPVSKLTGAAAGSLIGGAAGGIGSYLLTKNFYMQYKGTDKAGTEREMLLDSAKPLIALELLGGSEEVYDDLSLRAWERKLIKDFEKEIQESIASFFRQFGWKNITVTVQYPDIFNVIRDPSSSGSLSVPSLQGEASK